MARDPYAVLGVARTHQRQKSKNPIASSPSSIIQTCSQTTPRRNRHSRRYHRRIPCSAMKTNARAMTRGDAMTRGESTPPVRSGHRPISTIKPPAVAGFATRRGETRPTSTISSPICSAREADLALVDIDRSAARTPAVPPPGDDIHLTLPVVSWRSRARWQGPGADSDQAGVADNSNSGRVMPLKEQRGRHDGKPAAD